MSTLEVSKQAGSQPSQASLHHMMYSMCGGQTRSRVTAHPVRRFSLFPVCILVVTTIARISEQDGTRCMHVSSVLRCIEQRHKVQCTVFLSGGFSHRLHMLKREHVLAVVVCSLQYVNDSAM
jgi:hypothetical protein